MRFIGEYEVAGWIEAKHKIEPRTIPVQQNGKTGAWNSEIIRSVTRFWDHVPDFPVIEQMCELTETTTSIRTSIMATALLYAYCGSRHAIVCAKECLGMIYVDHCPSRHVGNWKSSQWCVDSSNKTT